jgi:hypothetical protein
MSAKCQKRTWTVRAPRPVLSFMTMITKADPIRIRPAAGLARVASGTSQPARDGEERRLPVEVVLGSELTRLGREPSQG